MRMPIGMVLGLSVILLAGMTTRGDEPEPKSPPENGPAVERARPEGRLRSTEDGDRRAGKLLRRRVRRARATTQAAAESQEEESSRDQAERQELDDRLDEARVQAEVLEMKREREKEQLRQAIQALTTAEFPLRGTNEAEPTEEERGKQKESLERIRQWVQELQAEYLRTTKELSRERRRVAELERRVGQQSGITVGRSVERRIRALERIIDQLLREAED